MTTKTSNEPNRILAHRDGALTNVVSLSVVRERIEEGKRAEIRRALLASAPHLSRWDVFESLAVQHGKPEK